MSLIPFPVRSRHDGRLPLATPPPLPRLTQRRAAALYGDETGAATAEYVVATIGPVGWCARASATGRSRETGKGTWTPTAVSALGAAALALVAPHPRVEHSRY